MRAALGIERDALLDTSDDGLQANERNVAQDVAREEAAKKATDPLLRESAAILGDAIGLLGADAKLAAAVEALAKAGPGAPPNANEFITQSLNAAKSAYEQMQAAAQQFAQGGGKPGRR